MTNADFDQYVLTPRGYSDFKKELESLRGVEKKVAIKRLKKAREMGSLDDNPEYEAAQDNLARVEARMAEIEVILAHAQVIKEKSGRKRKNKVRVGSQVVVKIDGEKDTFQIVSFVEADPSNRKISNESPVGRALLGAREGDLIKVDLGHSVLEYKVISVN